MSRLSLVGALVAVVVVLGAVFVYKTQPLTAPQPTVRIGYFNQHLGSVPLFTAEEQGIFKKYGIKVELQPVASSNLMTDELVRNDIDVGVISMIPVLNTEAKDPGRVKLLAASVITKASPFDEVVVKSDSGITSLTDPKIQKIGVFPGTTATNFLKEYLKRTGADVSKIEFVQMPPQNQLPALQSGAVQAVHLYEPSLTLAFSKGEVTPITQSIYATISDPSPIGGLALSGGFIQKNPELAKKTAQAIKEAIVFQNTHATETRATITSRFMLDSQVVAKMNLLPYTTFEDLSVDSFNSFVDLLMSMGELKVKPDVANIIYRSM